MGRKVSKKTLTVIILAISILLILPFVKADLGSCTQAKGIFCDNGDCIYPDQIYAGECVVSSVETIRGLDATQTQYIINKLTITLPGRLHFLGTAITQQGGGGTAGTGGKGEDDCCGQNAVDGGAGGNIFRRGISGVDGNSGDPGIAGAPGANILLTLNDLNSQGIISVSGTSGTSGTCNGYECNGGSDGCGGDGGAGGAGAGQIYLHINNQLSLTSNSRFYASGGNAGSGAHGSSDCGCCDRTCNNGCDDEEGGGGGGGGGAGAGGLIYFETLDDTKKATFESILTSAGVTILCNAGSVGSGGGGGLDYGNAGGSGGSASDGSCSPTFSVTSSSTEISGYSGVTGQLACFDSVNNDLDGYLDFEDVDCFNDPTFGWTVINGPLPMNPPGLLETNPIAPVWWNPSATNGADAVCGDDGAACYGNNLPNCGIITNMVTCGQTQGCMVGTSSYNAYGSYDCNSGTGDAECNSGYTATNPVTSTAWCCAEEPLCCEYGTMSCTSPPYYTFPPYISQVTCTGNVCVADPNYGSCGTRTTQTECLSASGCFWDTGLSLNKDYAYVFPFTTTNLGFMCYNNATFIKNPVNKWTWLDAHTNPFIITTINDSANRQIDFISNDEEWFYCDATNSNPTVNAKGINEYETFTPKGNVPSGEVACYEALNALFYPTHTFANGCSGGAPCCNVDGLLNPITAPRDNILGACILSGECSIDNGNLHQLFCTAFPQYCDGTQNPNILDPTFIQKKFCYFDLSGCMNRTIFDPAKSCTAQAPNTNYYHEVCDATESCLNGLELKTSNGAEDCCFGIDAECVTTPSTYEMCIALTGFQFNPDENYCVGDIFVRTSTDSCCLGSLFPLDQGYYTKGAPEAFICAKQNGKDIIAECGFDKQSLSNSFLVDNNVQINLGKSRLQSQGSVINTIRNFDKFDGTGTIQDLAYLLALSASSSIIPSTEGGVYNLSGYEYLEFDIAYSSKDFDLYFNAVTTTGCVGGIPLNIFDYVPSSEEPLRWHHVIIPVNALNGQSIYRNLCFDTNNPTLVNILVDNIVLSPFANSVLHSDNWYCAGGFGKWIPELDPNLTEYPLTHPSFYSTWNSYGPYKFGCEIQGAFGWTGHQCCGDDTRPNILNTGYYVENYTDSQGACFGGTYMLNDMSVAFAKGYVEGTNEFENYLFNDLLYTGDGVLLGCSVPDNKYVDMMLVYDPKKPSGYGGQGVPLFNPINNVRNECAVNGSYYCADNAWRQIINAPGYTGGLNGLALKSAPPGGNIIRNGDFSD